MCNRFDRCRDEENTSDCSNSDGDRRSETAEQIQRAVGIVMGAHCRVMPSNPNAELWNAFAGGQTPETGRTAPDGKELQVPKCQVQDCRFEAVAVFGRTRQAARCRLSPAFLRKRNLVGAIRVRTVDANRRAAGAR